MPFRKGDILEIISKDEEEWWSARDKQGRVGQIPVKYTAKVTNGEPPLPTHPQIPVVIFITIIIIYSFFLLTKVCPLASLHVLVRCFAL